MKFFDGISILGQKIFCKDSVLTSRVDAIEPLANKIMTEMIVIGDSFSIGYLSGGATASPNMSDMIADSLGLNLHNYGVGGAGYTINGNTFDMQATQAINDPSFNHNKVKYIFVIGGINDANFNPTADLKGASNALVYRLHSAFPDALIVLTPCWAAPTMTSAFEQHFRDICTVPVSFQNVITLYDNLKCLIGYSDLIGSDNIHPTQAGYTILAENILALLNGTGLARGKSVNLISNANWDVSSANVFRGEDFIRIFGFVKANVNITDPSQLTICQIDNGAPYAGALLKLCPSANRQVLVTFNPSDDLGDVTKGSIVLTNDYGQSVLANELIFFDEIVPLLNL